MFLAKEFLAQRRCLSPTRGALMGFRASGFVHPSSRAACEGGWAQESRKAFCSCTGSAPAVPSGSHLQSSCPRGWMGSCWKGNLKSPLP